MPQDVDQAIVAAIIDEAGRQEFYDHAQQLLLELAQIDNSPSSDVAAMAENEGAAYERIRREMAETMGDAIQVEFAGITPKIAEHHFFTPPHYTKTPDRPQGLSVGDAYAGRGNLLCTLPGANPDAEGGSIALNAHIDVVAPYFPPTVDGDTISGRGVADDKGSVVAMLLQMRLLKMVMDRFGVKLNKDMMYQFVTDEEPGGNGSLSVALDDSVQFDAICVGEITELKLHPANRGALWYKADLSAAGCEKVNTVEMAATMVLAMEDEGAQIKSESDHPLFPTRPVQTNHGAMGGFGKHPSSVNDLIVLRIQTADREAARQAVQTAVDAYVARYGDKTKETDEKTGGPKVAVHYELAEAADGITVKVNGKAGHMGAILECDNAITKAAYIIRAFMDRRDELAATVCLGAPSDPGTDALVLEGGQGFVPTHDITEVQRRITDAAVRGAWDYCASIGVDYSDAMVTMSFDKLHNDSFERPVDSPAMQAATMASKAVGIWTDEPILGWNVSCDARIFAKVHPDREVITFGAGSLAQAHSDDEFLLLSDVISAAKMETVMALSYCGYS